MPRGSSTRISKHSPLPPDVSSWQEAVDSCQGVRNLRLDDIAASGSFSGSTIPTTAFLQLRALWPKRKGGKTRTFNLLHKSGFVDYQCWDLAEKLLDGHGDSLQRFLKSLLDQPGSLPAEKQNEAQSLLAGHGGPGSYGKLGIFLDLIARTCSPAKSKTPPRQAAGHHAEEMGVFANCLTLWRLLDPTRTKDQTHQQTLATPRVFFEPTTSLGHQDIAQLDLKRTTSPIDVDNIERSEQSDDCSSAMSTPSKMPTKSAAPAAHVASVASTSSAPPAATAARSALTEAFSSLALNDSPASVRSSPQKAKKDDNGRTDYESQTLTFFIAFLHSLHLYAFPMSWDSHIEIKPEGRQYRLSKDSGDHKPHLLFRAVPDAAFYFKSARRGGERSSEAFAHVEVKPYRRGKSQRQYICYEESAEMVAIISDSMRSGDLQVSADHSVSVTHHRLAISLDQDQFWLIIATFNDNYLRYIKAAGETAPPDLTRDDFIEFQEVGPFDISSRDQMPDFCRAVLAISLKQLGGSEEGKDFKGRLESLVAERTPK